MGTGGGRHCRKNFNHWHHQLTERDAATAPTPADALHNVSNWEVIGFVCCIDHCQRKVLFISAENGTSSAGTRARPRFYWLCATSLTRMTLFLVFLFFLPCYNQLMLRPWTRRHQRTTDGPWIALHRRSACGILLTSVQTLSKSTFDCVTMQARAFPPNVAPHDVSTSPRLFIFRGQDALCLRDRAFAPYADDRSQQGVKEMRWPLSLLVLCHLARTGV